MNNRDQVHRVCFYFRVRGNPVGCAAFELLRKSTIVGFLISRVHDTLLMIHNPMQDYDCNGLSINVVILFLFKLLSKR